MAREIQLKNYVAECTGKADYKFKNVTFKKIQRQIDHN